MGYGSQGSCRNALFAQRQKEGKRVEKKKKEQERHKPKQDMLIRVTERPRQVLSSHTFTRLEKKQQNPVPTFVS